MKSHLHLLFVLVIGLLTGIGCDSSNDENPNQASLPAKPSNVIVLCDVSPSISLILSKNSSKYSRQTTQMAGKCRDIIRHYPVGSHISFYLISSNAIPHPFVRLDVKEIYQTQKQNILDELDSLDKRIAKVIDSASRYSENNTCILTSIENAFNEFNDYRHENDQHQNELIIFSDLLEQCNSTPAGRIQMNDASAEQLLSADERSRLISYKGDPEWKRLNANVLVVNTSPFMNAKLVEALKDLWQTIFENIAGANKSGGRLRFESNPTFARQDAYSE